MAIAKKNLEGASKEITQKSLDDALSQPFNSVGPKARPEWGSDVDADRCSGESYDGRSKQTGEVNQ